MIARARGVWLNLSTSLGFVPGLLVMAFAVLGIGLTEVDSRFDFEGNSLVFKGDGPAARTVLSVIAGSLITVAGLTFSITMVVLQLASSQFSPRILRTLFGDRVTQLTIGTFVGTFVYAILVLRAVGSFDDAGFVPRLSVTVASLLGIGAVVLLVVFLQHVSQMVQVSHVMAGVARDTLARIDVLYPEHFSGPGAAQDAAGLLSAWRATGEPAAELHPHRPGYVQRIDLEALAPALDGQARRVAVLACPGDFMPAGEPLALAWPAAAEDAAARAIRDVVSIGDERDLNQDIDFGLRQLTDTALRALSPGINDPMTAITCIGYIRSILVRLAGRADPPGVLSFAEHDVIVVARRREFGEYLDSLTQLSRYTGGDAWVAEELIGALGACAREAGRAEADERRADIRRVIDGVTERALSEACGAEDIRRIEDARAAALAA